MPRNKNAGKVKAEPITDTDTLTEENDTMTTATENDNYESEEDFDAFDISWNHAPEDYAPNRKTPGRTRRPSIFDEVLRREDVYEGGYVEVPVTSEEHKKFVVRELNRAKLFLNGVGRKEGEPEIGLALDLDKEDAVYFRSRLAQKRERKSGLDSDGENDSTDDDGDE